MLGRGVCAVFFLVRAAGAGRVVSALASSSVPLSIDALSALMRDREAQETIQMYQTAILSSIAMGLGAKNLPDIFEEVQKIRRGEVKQEKAESASVILTAEQGIFQFLK